MAKLDGFDMDGFDKWLETRPQVIKDLAKRFPPNVLYRIKDTGHRVFVRGYDEDGTLIMHVGSEFNRITFAHDMSGVPPEDLEECDFPPDDEPVGALLTDENDIKEYLHLLRKKAEDADLS